MLAATGFLGLLLMGAAVGGLFAGADDSFDTGTDEGDAPEDAAESGGRDGSDAHTGGGLADLLLDDDVEEESGSLPHDFLDDGLTPPFAGPATPAEDDLLEIEDTTAFGEGPDIPFVSDFDCETDRLVLDFAGHEQDAPTITVDLESSPGDAVIEANGVAVTLVRDAPDMTPGHVDVVMAGQDDTWPDDDDGVGEAGEGLSDGERPRVVTDFDPERDAIEVLYDAAALPDPEIGVTDFDDGRGASITVNGEPVLHVVGAQGVQPSEVVLRAM